MYGDLANDEHPCVPAVPPARRTTRAPAPGRGPPARTGTPPPSAANVATAAASPNCRAPARRPTSHSRSSPASRSATPAPCRPTPNTPARPIRALEPATVPGRPADRAPRRAQRRRYAAARRSATRLPDRHPTRSGRPAPHRRGPPPPSPAHIDRRRPCGPDQQAHDVTPGEPRTDANVRIIPTPPPSTAATSRPRRLGDRRLGLFGISSDTHHPGEAPVAAGC